MSPAFLGDLACIPDMREQGTIGNEIAPWSYEVETPAVQCMFKRNWRYIIHLPAEDISSTTPDLESHESNSEMTSDD